MHRISNLMFQHLLPFHVLTGSDSSSFLVGHSMKSAFIFYHTDTLQDCEKLICKINNAVEADTTNEVRTILFKRGIKAELLIPTSDSLK